MRTITLDELARLRARFLPDRPGPLVALHALHSGVGCAWVDRWPDPGAVLVESGGNWALHGNPAGLRAEDLRGRVVGFLDAAERFDSLVLGAFPGAVSWSRVVFTLPGRPRLPPLPGSRVRRLTAGDRDAVEALTEDSAWISRTWGGARGLTAAEVAWGAFPDGELAAVACPFFVGDRYEDIGVVTEPRWRGRGLGGACAARVCEDIAARGRAPSWTTSPDNIPSIRAAQKLGFLLQRNDRLHVIGVPVPPPASPPGHPRAGRPHVRPG